MIVYTAGPYQKVWNEKGNKVWLRKSLNIKNARAIAVALWEKGFTVICPHLNTLNFEHYTTISNSEFVKADMEIIEKVDALVMLPNWEFSKGARHEKKYAEYLKIPVYIWPETP